MVLVVGQSDSHKDLSKFMMMNLKRNKAVIVSDLVKVLGAGEHRMIEYFNHSSNLVDWVRKNLKQARRGVYVLPGAPSKAAAVSETASTADMAALIRERFDVLTILADGVAANNIRSLIVAGAPGVGKTYTLEERLLAAKASGKVKSLNSIKGSISAIGLYIALWENRKAGNVILLDDIDRVFDDEETMNLLKGALDTTKRRTISWIKASGILKDNDIPNSFDYEGQIVFITNKNPDEIIAKGSKMAPHMAALVSRSVFLDLAIHDARQIMVRIEQVLKTTDMINDLAIGQGDVDLILNWMHSNIDRVRSISLRTVIQLASFIKTTPNWVSLANTTMLKGAY